MKALDDLERLCAAATPDPIEVETDDFGEGPCVSLSDRKTSFLFVSSGEPSWEAAKNSAEMRVGRLVVAATLALPDLIAVARVAFQAAETETMDGETRLKLRELRDRLAARDPGGDR